MTEHDTGDDGPRRLEGAEVTRRWLVRTTFAIVISLGVFTLIVFALLRTDDDESEIIGAARLSWNAETDDPLGEGKAASVEVIDADGGFEVFVFDIEVLRPPAEIEFIEAWLVDTSSDDRLSVGVFDEIRTRVFTLPDGSDPLRYDRVEFSLEPDDGDAGYSGRTLIRGEIVWIADPPG